MAGEKYLFMALLDAKDLYECRMLDSEHYIITVNELLEHYAG